MTETATVVTGTAHTTSGRITTDVKSGRRVTGIEDRSRDSAHEGEHGDR
jgi:hypothetical protein